MDRTGAETCDSPLEKILENLEAHDPPADLEARCLSAIRDLHSQEQFARCSVWKPVLVAAAAGLVISLLGVTSLPVTNRAGGRAGLVALEHPTEPPLPLPPTSVPRLQREYAPESPPPAPAVRGVGRPAEKVPAPPGAPRAGAREAPPAASPGLPAGPGATPAGSPAPAGAGDALALAPAAPAAEAPTGRPADASWEEADHSRATLRRPAQKPAAPPPASGPQPAESKGEMTITPAETPPPPPPTDYGNEWRNGPDGLEKPWYDFSSERQRIIRTVLGLAVDKVQEAYDDAKAIIEKADGYIEQADLRLEKGAKREAHITARVPVDDLEGVVAQLRQLGEVTLMKSESEDVTREYRGRGAQIRDLGATEDELVRQYLATKDRAAKQRLYEQIMSLRARNQSQKGALKDLSGRTHLAVLEVTLTEKLTPLRFLASAAEHAGAAIGWIAVTAFIWLPLLVLGIWGLRRNRA